MRSDPNSDGKKSDTKIRNFFNFNRGTFSVVREGLQRQENRKYALKFIDKRFVDDEDFRLLVREVNINFFQEVTIGSKDRYYEKGKSREHFEPQGAI
jgi:hypothetical protein